MYSRQLGARAQLLADELQCAAARAEQAAPAATGLVLPCLSALNWHRSLTLKVGALPGACRLAPTSSGRSMQDALVGTGKPTFPSQLSAAAGAPAACALVRTCTPANCWN